MFSCTTIICDCFSTSIETPPQHGFWTLQQYLLVTKIVDYALFFWFARIKRSYGWPIDSTFWPVNKALIWALSVRARIAIVNNDSSFHVRFSNISADFRLTNYGVPPRIERPTMLKWNSRHMTSCAEETGDHLLRSDFCTNNFRWIWLGFKDATLDCCFVSGSYSQI